jgi:signal transduction histidine kinase
VNLSDLLRVARDPRLRADATIALALYAATEVTTPVDPFETRQAVAGLLVSGVACGALVVRRRFPFTVVLVSAVAAEAYLVIYLYGHGELVLGAPMVALYTVADSSNRRRGLLIGGLVVVGLAGIHILLKPQSPLGADNLVLAALGALAVAAGDASRNHRAYLAEVEARARQAEADRDAEAARRVTEERLRIARDLHDVVGHHLALIHVQAGVAMHVLGDPPEPARRALEHINSASRTALAELSETVRLLRRPGDPAAPTEPATGLAGVPRLLAAFRSSGLTIADEVSGPVRPVTAGTDLTAYRIIQESLTNICKHAGPTSVTLRLVYEPHALRIVVENKRPVRQLATSGGAGSARRCYPDDPGTGLGLVGMRERVTALGGQLQTGPRPDGGYRVSAALPLASGDGA